MLTDRDRQSLVDIINSITLAGEYLQNKSQIDFEQDPILQDAIIRRIEIVGEAAARLSETARNDIPTVSWKQIIGMRNIMIHQYDRVDLKLVWDTVNQAFPILAQSLQPYL
jgi:uncharacterized protein with HEPN domain